MNRKFCKVDNCKRCSDSHGYCRQHKKQLDRNGYISRSEPYPSILCDTPGCKCWAEFKGLCWGCYQSARRRLNKSHRRHDLKKKYGLSMEDYERLLKEQDGKCKICGRAETSFDSQRQTLRLLAVDHSHTTGKIRALLCSRCNTTLGKVNEDIDLLKKMIVYLAGSDNP